MVICVMGVAGAGKTTIAKLLAVALQAKFLDADTLHPAANIAKMSQGIPLDDADRAPWLAAVRDFIVQTAPGRQQSVIIACSALKQKYRDFLAADVKIIWVYLKASKELIQSRLAHRQQHFMKANMLDSQFRDLEEPQAAIVVDANVRASDAVQRIIDGLPACKTMAR